MPNHTRATNEAAVRHDDIVRAYYNILERCDAANPGSNPAVELPIGCYWPPMVKAVKGEKPGWELFVVARPVWRLAPAEV